MAIGEAITSPITPSGIQHHSAYPIPTAVAQINVPKSTAPAPGVTAPSGLSSVSESVAGVPALRSVEEEVPAGVDDERKIPAIREMEGRDATAANGDSAFAKSATD